MPDSLPIALVVQNMFGRLFSNNYEIPTVEHIALRVESQPGRKSYTIDSAWLEKGEAAPGDNLKVRVLCSRIAGRTHRRSDGACAGPDARGATLRVLVSDATG